MTVPMLNSSRHAHQPQTCSRLNYLRPEIQKLSGNGCTVHARCAPFGAITKLSTPLWTLTERYYTATLAPRKQPRNEFLAVQSESGLYRAKVIHVQHIGIQMHTYKKLSKNAHHKILPAQSTVTVTL